MLRHRLYGKRSQLKRYLLLTNVDSVSSSFTAGNNNVEFSFIVTGTVREPIRFL